MSQNKIEGHVIIITGASLGIGAATAKLLATQGAKLVLAARSVDKLEQLAAELKAESLVVPTDMTEGADLENLVAKTLEHYGRIDGLVNNAGHGQYGPLELLTEEAIRRQFEVNVIGLLLLTQKVIPTMRAQGKGRIVNISSLSGLVALPFSGLYHGSKFALEGLSDSLRMELAPFGIQVSLVEPGPVKTDFFEVAREQSMPYLEGPYKAASLKTQAQMDSFTRDAWEPERVAPFILKALADENSHDRYQAFSGGVFLANALKLTPKPITDRIFRNLFGLDRLIKS
ncbi:MAG: SDR family oxidoreductase [Gloeobacterales cyanobacterium]